MGVAEPLVRDGSVVAQLVEAAARIMGGGLTVGQTTDLTIEFGQILKGGANLPPKPHQATWLAKHSVYPEVADYPCDGGELEHPLEQVEVAWYRDRVKVTFRGASPACLTQTYLTGPPLKRDVIVELAEAPSR
jgi:hypothetical protein